MMADRKNLGASAAERSGVVAPKDASASLKFGMSAILRHSTDNVKRSPPTADSGNFESEMTAIVYLFQLSNHFK